MAIPSHVKYLVIGAGIHGLSTAYHLAQKLKASGNGDGRDILVVDKGGIAAGPSGIACGVITSYSIHYTKLYEDPRVRVSRDQTSRHRLPTAY